MIINSITRSAVKKPDSSGLIFCVSFVCIFGLVDFESALRNPRDFVLALLTDSPQIRAQTGGVKLLRKENRHDQPS